MLKTALSLCLLGLLSVGSAAARPASWPFWFSSPERHGQRKLPGDYTHHYGTYRYHSHQDNGVFSFLHGSGRASARHQGPLHARKSSHRRTTGLF
ncbi:hypothetical protein [Hymenobacter psoromatis]|uniref:hypothetical protein n=1 Tax=Hymenobacter psoromatis TaxID=1484116 RepID=UPI001CBB5A42|nr:hypothetical protein [Hymenobacter psoromatis]